ncbi:1-phosphatidylinositol-3-phosphate 5-kinase FAB1A isoform X2 [Brassica napus]|nr:1-phosphatidylinositol-3-phosphate 5-kinase FAB1A isoform X2 [Brassica napus]XP_013670646.1 1-phosphatidylinositol-3-phosphate 5-kinase FAB1A isoform X2 [Brassica napus]
MRIWCFHCFTDDHEEEENRNRGGVSHRLQKQSAMDDNNNNNKGGDFVGFDLNDRELGVAEMLAREENGAELERVRSSEIRSHQLVQGESSNEDCTMEEADHDSYHKRAKVYSGLAGKGTIPEDVGSDIPSESSEGGKENVVEPSQVVKAMLSESQTQATTDLSDTLDAAWIGEQTASENNGISRPPSRAASANGTQSYDLKLSDSESGLTSNEEQTMQVQMPSPSFYYSLNKNYSLNSRKHIMAEDRPVYVSSYRELEWQSGARLLLPLGINDLVLPVYDDEPTSIIAYALTSSEYKAPFHFLIL